MPDTFLFINLYLIDCLLPLWERKRLPGLDIAYLVLTVCPEHSLGPDTWLAFSEYVLSESIQFLLSP